MAASSLQEYGYARLLRRQVEEVFRDNRMVAVCQYNYMPGEDMVLMRHYLRKHNIEVKFVLNEVGGWGSCRAPPAAAPRPPSPPLSAASHRSSGPCCPSLAIRTSSRSLCPAISFW